MWNPVIWRKVAWLIATAIVATGVYVSTALAMAGAGFTGTTLALGRSVDDIDVNNIQVSQPTDHNSIQAVVKGPVTLTAPKEAPAAGAEQETSSTGLSVASQNQRVLPNAPPSAYSMDVPLAYYNLSFTLSKRTGGITPPVQGRIFAYMGLALYESVVSGMPHNRSIAGSFARHRVAPHE